MKIKVGSDFSGVGAFNQALIRLGIDYDEVFACDMDKYARQTFVHNYGEPFYYPENVYDRAIPTEPLDVYMTSPPCQGFSMAGKREGSVLFFNSHEFIQKNKPRYFIFENVKGLLSHEEGRTFQMWIDHLGGKTVNGNPVIFPHEDSVPYHIYYKVLNAKHYGVPQNRERIFIVGIRDDADNNFRWPKKEHLTKRLKDVLETEVDEKYFLSDKMISGFINKPTPGFENRFKPLEKSALNANTITTNNGSRISDNFIMDSGYINQDTQASQVHSKYKESPTISAGTHGYANGYIQIKSATKNGYELATVEDSINFSVPNSETRRGRVGKGVAQTLDTACNQAVICAMRGRNPDNPNDRTTGAPVQQMIEVNKFGTSNALTTVQKDNLVLTYDYPKVKLQLTGGKWDKTHEQSGRVYDENGIGPTVHTMGGGNQEPKTFDGFKIRRLTPRECFRLMDFPDSFEWPVSDSQAYKQAGNSIVVRCLELIIKNLITN